MARLKTLQPRVRALGARPAGSGWTATSTQSTTARGYGAAWRQLREQALARDCGLCQVCKLAGRVTAASEVDHVVNKARGGTDDLSNLQAICRDCHAAKTAVESGGRRRHEVGADGWPTGR